MIITWTTPNNGGSPITNYTITIRNSLNIFITELTGCNGANATIVSTTRCTVLLSVLTASPFNLVLGDSIDVQIIAWNIYGNSSSSVIGSGANIVVLPSAPFNFANVASITLATQIGLSW